jgi:hypothetical protein
MNIQGAWKRRAYRDQRAVSCDIDRTRVPPDGPEALRQKGHNLIIVETILAHGTGPGCYAQFKDEGELGCF